MVATNVKAETLKLMDKRTALELEMNLIIERLSQPGGPGLAGNLLDSEGFPRSDIDIPAVRADRNRLIMLRNDHKDITEKINQNLQVLHSARLAPTPVTDLGNANEPNRQGPIVVSVGTSASSNNVLQGNINAMGVDLIFKRPFAIVDEITEGSPAAEDGLQLGDQIVKFGIVESGDNLFSRLVAEAQENEGRAVTVVVMRQGALVNLSVTPRRWQGRGLLGYNVRILS